MVVVVVVVVVVVCVCACVCACACAWERGVTHSFRYKPLVGEVFAPSQFPALNSPQLEPEQVTRHSVDCRCIRAHVCGLQTLELAHVYGFDTRAWRALAFVSDDEVVYAVGSRGQLRSTW